ncbi:sugar phosphate isomerase/epimerase family protein [Kamptonema cortianum]|nr:sugar phosphate isomerase/epimerase family protein [Geitlerinema splendidum]MDK3158605.1 sugar phosphate isomerase/epimerase family protein [Kamptonema cortianum]
MPYRVFDRRELLKSGVLAGATLAFGDLRHLRLKPEPWFQISLAQWSLHRELNAGRMTNLDFPRIARQDYGIEAVEYVNVFFMEKARDTAYLKELNKRCEDEGVKNLLIMCDREGNLGDPDPARRKQAVENHHKWVEAAVALGCHSIRVNARSEGSREEQAKLCVDGLRRLGEFGASYKINVIVENHGGLSSMADWLVPVIQEVNMPNVGTLPDFGNFYEYNRYKGVKEMMPYAKGVSAKSHAFDAEGNDTGIDYRVMMKIVKLAGYRGYVGIEYEGAGPEPDGIRATKALLERLRDELADY